MELSHLAQLHIIWMWMHPFLEVSAHALLQVATKGKKSKTVEFLGNFAKRRSATKVNWLFFHNFGTFIPHSGTYFLVVSARAL